LKLLDLIDSEGNPTEEFEKASRAPEADFRDLVKDILVLAYSDVFAFADPATEGIERIRDAFRTYTPKGQQERMVTLFLGLLDWLGLDVSAARAVRAERPAGARRQARGIGKTNAVSHAPRVSSARLPAPLLSLLQDALPKDGEGWPRLKREAFLKTFEALLDLYYPITAVAALAAGTEPEGGPGG
jgi:hypothetical protein